MAQFGRLNRHMVGTTIRAWSIATETSYRFNHLPLKPALRLRANIASGDGDPKDDRLGTFNPLFPKGQYFGELSPIGPYNIINLHPDLELDLGSAVTLALAGIVYTLAGELERSADGARARVVGSQAKIALSWVANQPISFSMSYARFVPGKFLQQTGSHRTI